MLEAEITNAGDVLVEGQHVGLLHGFRFTPDPSAEGEAQKTLNAAAQKALVSEIEGRAQRVNDAVDQAFVLAHDGTLRWLGEAVGRITAGDHILTPKVRVLADEQLSGPGLEMVQRRLDLWVAQHIKKLLGPLSELETGEGLEGIARGIAFQTAESLGVLERSRVASDIKGLDQSARGALRKLGVRFGAHHLYVQQLLKPAPRALAAQLWALKHGGLEVVKGFDEVPHLAASGRTSIPANKEAPRGLYLAAGFRVCGERAVRVDILERLADLIRPAISYRPGVTPGEPPAGAADGDGFVVTVAMTSLVGCSGEAFASILKSLGYNVERRKGAAITVPLVAAAATQPLKPQAAEQEAQEDAAEGVEAAADEALEAAAPEEAEAAQSAPETTEAIVEDAPAAVVEEMAPAEAEIVAEAAPEAAIEATAEEAPVETAAEGEAVTDAEAPVEAEELFTEVWRPHRQNRNENRRPQRGGRGPQARQASAEAAPAAEAGAGQAPRPEGERRSDGGGRRFDRKFGDKFGDKSRAPGENRSQPQGQPQENRGENRSRPEGQGDRPRRDDRRGGKPQRDDRGSSRQFATTEAPKSRDRQPDPNSPFAKLLALKAQLEGKGAKD
jgi:ATP-dependent RNA helicase SUPV3L1/SUV3